jgi:putative phage-type endonuclease
MPPTEEESVTDIRLSESTKAVYLDTLENGSEEWLKLRRSGIGGSEVGTILGLNRWESAFTLWAKKTGRIEETSGGSEAMEWGTRLEPVILDKFAEEHPDLTLYREVGTWAHPEREWQRANPDAVFETRDGEFGIIEVKTAQFEDDWNAGVPRYYETQVQWYLQTFGYASAYVVALFHGNRYREFEVKAEPFTQEANLEAVEQFRKYLIEDYEPDFDGSSSTYETVRALHPEIDPDVEVELGELAIYYFDAVDILTAAEADVTEIKSRILSAMGTAKRGLLDGEWVLTRQARGTGTPYLVTKRG